MSLINSSLEHVNCSNLVSNHVLIRLIRFVSWFTIHLCNAIYFSTTFSTLCKRFTIFFAFCLYDRTLPKLRVWATYVIRLLTQLAYYAHKCFLLFLSNSARCHDKFRIGQILCTPNDLLLGIHTIKYGGDIPPNDIYKYKGNRDGRKA